jgi:hypothetical protein
MQKTITTKCLIAGAAVLSVLIIGLSLFLSIKKARNTEEDIKLEVFQIKEGWGFQILVKDKVYIYQPVIPAIGGNKAFPSRESAEKIGQLFISNLQHNGKLPHLTEEEIDDLKKLK